MQQPLSTMRGEASVQPLTQLQQLYTYTFNVFVYVYMCILTKQSLAALHFGVVYPGPAAGYVDVWMYM